MKKKRVIKTSYLPSEEIYREFNKTCGYRDRIFSYSMCILMCLFSFFLLLMEDYSFCFKYGIFILAFLCFAFFLDYNNLAYKQLLVRMNHEISKFEIDFTEEKIVSKVGKNKQDYDYSLVKKILEGDRLLILRLPSNLGIIVSKNTMDEDDIRELRSLLLDKCSVKKIYKVPSKIYLLKFIAWILGIINFCLSFVLFLTK